VLNIIDKTIGSIQKHGWLETIRRVGGFSLWATDRYIFKRRYVTRQVHEYCMMLDMADPGISTTLAKGILREKDQVAVVREELKEGDVVLDIGANIGYYALLEACLVGPSGRIFAVEPVPSNFELLGKNILLNRFEDRIEKRCLAVSDRSGETPFYLSDHSNLGSFFNTDMGTGEKIGYIKNDHFMVPTEDIRQVLKNKDRLDFIRMDIEGAEVEVLRGLADVVKGTKLRPKILFETHRSRYHADKHDIADPLRGLFAMGYRVKTLISNEPGATWRIKGYAPRRLLRTDGIVRGLYDGVKNEDAVDIICRIGGVRAVLLAPC